MIFEKPLDTQLGLLFVVSLLRAKRLDLVSRQRQIIYRVEDKEN